MRVVSLLKQINAVAAAGATEDQASDHTAQTQPRREEFELDIIEGAPTEGQVKTILDYLSKDQVPRIFQGSNTPGDALKAFKRNPGSFIRPVVGVSLSAPNRDILHRTPKLTHLQVVDWNNGKVVAGDNKSEILKMLGELNKS